MWLLVWEETRASPRSNIMPTPEKNSTEILTQALSAENIILICQQFLNKKHDKNDVRRFNIIIGRNSRNLSMIPQKSRELLLSSVSMWLVSIWCCMHHRNSQDYRNLYVICISHISFQWKICGISEVLECISLTWWNNYIKVHQLVVLYPHCLKGLWNAEATVLCMTFSFLFSCTSLS